MLGENLKVAGCQVQHEDIVRVLKDVFDLAGREEVFDILRDAGRNAAPFSESLPDFDAIGGSLLFFQKQVHFVDLVSGGFPSLSVDRDAIPHLILYHQHPDFFELFTQLLNVIGHDTAVKVNIGAVVEYIE